MRRVLLFCLILAAFGFTPAQQKAEDLLLSGPMVGYTEMREALLWVQTTTPAQVQFVYFAKDDTDRIMRTAVYQTNNAEANTARLIANQVQPGKEYIYQLIINGKLVQRPYELRFKTPPLWQFRTDPPEMKIALGSCVFVNDETYDRPGRPYGGEYDIFTKIHNVQPDMMLWLGDNTYLREADWYSWTGIMHRNTHTRAVKEMQALLASTSNYAIWDDHDFGPNNSDRTFRDKDLTLRAFKLFWGNPSYGLPDVKGGTTSMFSRGDADFFMLDNRYFRDPNNKRTGKRSILGKEQLDWFIDALISSNATFKFVMIGGQVVNTVDRFENYAAIAPEERSYILNAIARESIKNVIFLSGDRHHSELSKVEKDGITIYDFTVSPLTSGPHNAEDEPNALRVKGSQVGIRNYGIMDISGPRKERKLKFSLFDQSGKELWSMDINAE